MSYTINVPLAVPLQFPDLCPYSERPAPKSTVHLSKTTTSMILPIPGVGIYNSYRKSTLRLPTDRSVARRFLLMRLLPAFILLGAAAIIAWMNLADITPWQSRLGFRACLLAVPLAGIAHLLRLWCFRQVRLGDLWETHIEVHFSRENFARQFSELNNLPIVE